MAGSNRGRIINKLVVSSFGVGLLIGCGSSSDSGGVDTGTGGTVGIAGGGVLWNRRNPVDHWNRHGYRYQQQNDVGNWYWHRYRQQNDVGNRHGHRYRQQNDVGNWYGHRYRQQNDVGNWYGHRYRQQNDVGNWHGHRYWQQNDVGNRHGHRYRQQNGNRHGDGNWYGHGHRRWNRWGAIDGWGTINGRGTGNGRRAGTAGTATATTGAGGSTSSLPDCTNSGVDGNALPAGQTCVTEGAGAQCHFDLVQAVGGGTLITPYTCTCTAGAIPTWTCQ